MSLEELLEQFAKFRDEFTMDQDLELLEVEEEKDDVANSIETCSVRMISCNSFQYKSGAKKTKRNGRCIE